ncbi:unnamed protein product [Ilex paraguariensis]|uniref:Uncharacterized protein n=1 Tax=Ilex paraguariensis TaxID=185542 RepID=A0ABC8SVT8_9AQUA
MGWSRRSKYAFDALRNFTSKIVPKNPIRPTNPIRESIQKTNHQFSSTPNLNQSRGSGFAFSSSPTCRILGFEFGLEQNQYSPFLHGIKRYYSVDRSKVNHFWSRGPRRWYKKPRIVLTVTLVGGFRGFDNRVKLLYVHAFVQKKKNK